MDQNPLEEKSTQNGTSSSQGEQILEQFRLYHKKKSPELRAELISRNLDLVIPMAKKYKLTGECLEDIIQVGYIGLIKAVDNFDPERGIQFSTYATHCINGEIRHYIRDKTEAIKTPRWLKNLNKDVAVFVENYLQKQSRLPTIKEISKGLNIAEEGIIEILKAKNVISLNQIEESAGETIDYRAIKSNQYETFRLPLEDRIVLEQTIEKLRMAEKSIIYLFFFKDLTQTQIASALGVSQKKVSRLLKKSLEKMKEIISPRKSEKPGKADE